MEMMNDSILVELDPEPDKVASGLLFKPQDAHEHIYRTGKVVQVGPGRWAKNQMVRLPVGVEPGEGVVFIKFVATATKTAQGIQETVGKDRAIIHPTDVLLVYDRNDPPVINQ